MPPKRGRKRKHAGTLSNSNGNNANVPLTPPDRATWPGWVEMESEPAFFNVMLQEMGVRGVKIQEVLGLDEEMLAMLPRPIHALIFLFRYKDTDQADQQEVAECPSHIWFANQIPDFACASVALLNIVYNINGLHIGPELRAFRDLTLDMDPMSRGDAIDEFGFVKRIHNSFARETDLLIADMHLKEKAARAIKRQALAKARQAREMNRAGKAPAPAPATTENLSRRRPSTPSRTSERMQAVSSKLTPPVTNGSRASTPLSKPDFKTARKDQSSTSKFEEASRRSKRKPRPIQNISTSNAFIEEDADTEGFHFIAYIPNQGHIWKLDGLDSFPQDVGVFDDTLGGEWINVVQPTLQTRMAAYEGADIKFNLMAVVHDSTLTRRDELLRNVKELQLIDKKLEAVSPQWELQQKTHDDVTIGICSDLGLSQIDIEEVDLPDNTVVSIIEEVETANLVEHRKQAIAQQAPLRGLVREGLVGARLDNEKARHRRYDYTAFVRSWLGALAEQDILSNLLEVEGI